MSGDTLASTPWRDARHVHPARGDARHVLVAEDDREMRRLVVETLRRDGYAVSEVANGEELLLRLTTPPSPSAPRIDLIVSDIRMPEYTGLEVVDALRRSRRTTPVILMTAFGDRETRALADSLNAVLFDKPFAMDDLRTAVLNLLPRT
jgi:CheY-like chemotaxis protein